MNNAARDIIAARTSTLTSEQDAPMRVLRNDVDLLSRLVNVTLSHARVVLESHSGRNRVDGQRDALHLIARVEGLERQLDHTSETLRRIEAREPAVRRSRPGAPRPEETITVSLRPS